MALIEAIGFITLIRTADQYVDEKNITHIDIVQEVTGGTQRGEENRVVDSVKRSLETEAIGQILEWSRWTDLSDIDDRFLRTVWVHVDKGGSGNAGLDGERQIEVCSSTEGVRCMTKAVWGFIELKGKRYRARKATCICSSMVAICTGVYGWREYA